MASRASRLWKRPQRSSVWGGGSSTSRQLEAVIIADAGSAATSYSSVTAIALHAQGKIHIGYFDNHRAAVAARVGKYPPRCRACRKIGDGC